MGIGADISSAESRLMQAEQLLQSQNYEQSIQCAGSATQLARQVYYAAMQQAMMQQEAAAMAEQRRLAARIGGTAVGRYQLRNRRGDSAAAATILENAAASTPSQEVEPEPEPATAGGSWGGETAQGELVTDASHAAT